MVDSLSRLQLLRLRVPHPAFPTQRLYIHELTSALLEAVLFVALRFPGLAVAIVDFDNTDKHFAFLRLPLLTWAALDSALFEPGSDPGNIFPFAPPARAWSQL